MTLMSKLISPPLRFVSRNYQHVGREYLLSCTKRARTEAHRHHTTQRSARLPSCLDHEPHLWNSLRKGCLLKTGRSLQLLGIQVADKKFIVERLQLDSLDDVEWVNDIPQALAHLPTFRVSDKRMTVNLTKRDASSELDAEHYHPRAPEEDDVVASLQNRLGVESFHVRRFSRPTERGEWPQSRAKPRVEDIGISDKLELLARELFSGLFFGGFLCSSSHPTFVVAVLTRLALELDKVCRSLVSPPELEFVSSLSGNTMKGLSPVSTDTSPEYRPSSEERTSPHSLA